jgi:hypothetical protein
VEVVARNKAGIGRRAEEGGMCIGLLRRMGARRSVVTPLGSREGWGAEALYPTLVGTVEVFRIRIMPWPQAAECNMITNKQTSS